MAASSSSKAADLPDWHRRLLAVPPTERNRTQQDAVRSLEILAELRSETSKQSPIIIDNPKRALKVTSSVFELTYRGYMNTWMTVVFLEQEKTDPLNKALKDIRVPIVNPLDASKLTPAQLPMTLLSILAVLHHHDDVEESALKCLDVLEQPKDEDDEEDKWQRYNAVSLMNSMIEAADLWLAWKPFWKDLKALGADDLLKSVCSTVTVDQLEFWSKGFIAMGDICRFSLQENRTTMLKALDATTNWISELKTAPHGYKLTMAHRMCRVLEDRALSFFNGVRVFGRIDWAMHGFRMRSLMLQAYGKALESYLNAARADEDHAAVAWAAAQYGIVFEMFSSGLNNDSNKVQSDKIRNECLEESKNAYALCKKWLPPGYYKKARGAIEYLEMKVAGMKKHSTITAAEREVNQKVRMRLEKRCIVCFSEARQVPLQLCSQCKKVYYCSKECQKKDWKQHKKVCKSLAASE